MAAVSEPRAVLVRDTGVGEVYDIEHNGQTVAFGLELAKPAAEDGDWEVYCRELLPGKYEFGWERKP